MSEENWIPKSEMFALSDFANFYLGKDFIKRFERFAFYHEIEIHKRHGTIRNVKMNFDFDYYDSQRIGLVFTFEVLAEDVSNSEKEISYGADSES